MRPMHSSPPGCPAPKAPASPTCFSATINPLVNSPSLGLVRWTRSPSTMVRTTSRSSRMALASLTKYATSEVRQRILAQRYVTELPKRHTEVPTSLSFAKGLFGALLTVHLRDRRVGDAEVRIVNPVPHKFFGFGPIDVLGYKVIISDREKTAIDCIDRPELAGGGRGGRA